MCVCAREYVCVCVRVRVRECLIECVCRSRPRAADLVPLGPPCSGTLTTERRRHAIASGPHYCVPLSRLFVPISRLLAPLLGSFIPLSRLFVPLFRLLAPLSRFIARYRERADDADVIERTQLERFEHPLVKRLAAAVAELHLIGRALAVERHEHLRARPPWRGHIASVGCTRQTVRPTRPFSMFVCLCFPVCVCVCVCVALVRCFPVRAKPCC